MARTKNPYKQGDHVRIKRGDGTLQGTVAWTKLATVFVILDDNGRVVQETYSDVALCAEKKEQN